MSKKQGQGHMLSTYSHCKGTRLAPNRGHCKMSKKQGQGHMDGAQNTAMLLVGYLQTVITS
jgi:hypothetical protein